MHMTNENRQIAFIAAGLRLKERAVTGKNTPPSDRRQRALQTCHRPAEPKRQRYQPPGDSRAYVPELSARLEDDPNLTDGARRCARKIAELAYRSQRESRALPVTVSFLARALGRCGRTVQRYLRQLEREGYVAVDVVAGRRSRMCIGLVVHILTPLIAAHHKTRWPGGRGNPGATPESLNHRYKHFKQAEGRRVSVEQWALRCMDGVFRSFMKTGPLADLPAIVLR